MHRVSQEKNADKNIQYQVGYAEKLPTKIIFSKLFHVPMVCEIMKTDNKASKRFLMFKKNGYFLFMEFGLPKANLIKKPYQAFLDYFLPFSGSIVAKDRHSYKYLADSIKAFPLQTKFKMNWKT